MLKNYDKEYLTDAMNAHTNELFARLLIYLSNTIHIH